MEENDNILTGYCFLAALTENQNDLYNHVFVPVCKRALSLYSLSGASHGHASDIQKIILNEYGIDVPIVMVRRLINSTYKSLSNRIKENHKFKVLQNGEYFELDKYSFSDLEVKYKKGQRNAKAIQNAFIEYLKSEGYEDKDVPSFTEFLNKNKKHLARFFKGSEAMNGDNLDKTFIHHVHFLEYIETSSHELFEIAQGLYVGSIVASFLEAGLDLEPKFENKEEYYLDTPIVLRALDLQKEEETQPIKELLDLVRKTGGQLKILSITIDEIHSVIENAIGNYNSSVPTSTINEACIRLKKNKAWLINFNSKLEENIINELKVTSVLVTPSFKEKNSKANDVKALQSTRRKKGNAIHDVLAYLFVREQRGGAVNSFQKARIWFLTTNSNLLSFNLVNHPVQGISEIVLTDALTSLLWLKDPSKLLTQVKSIGLSELLANTLNEEIASKELITEFESNLSAFPVVSQDEYKTLLEAVAHESAKRIDHLNELLVVDKEKAKLEAHKIVERERTRKAKQQKTIKDAQQKEKKESEKSTELSEKNTKLLEKIASIEAQLKQSTEGSQTVIEKMTDQIASQAAHIGEIKRSLKRARIYFVIFFVCLLGFLIIYFYGAGLITWLKWLIEGIVALGGFWSFLNFALNAIKSSRGK